MEELEELWAPFKAKRQTRAQMAKEKGLEPLDPRNFETKICGKCLKLILTLAPGYPLVISRWHGKMNENGLFIDDVPINTYICMKDFP